MKVRTTENIDIEKDYNVSIKLSDEQGYKLQVSAYKSGKRRGWAIYNFRTLHKLKQY